MNPLKFLRGATKNSTAAVLLRGWHYLRFYHRSAQSVDDLLITIESPSGLVEEFSLVAEQNVCLWRTGTIRRIIPKRNDEKDGKIRSSRGRGRKG